MKLLELITKGIFPGILGFCIYKLERTKDEKKVADNIQWIIEGGYSKIQYSNFLDSKIKYVGITKNKIGYNVLFKLPVGFEVEKMRNLEELLDMYNDAYTHFIEVVKEEKINDITNKYLSIDVINNNKMKEYIATNK